MCYLLTPNTCARVRVCVCVCPVPGTSFVLARPASSTISAFLMATNPSRRTTSSRRCAPLACYKKKQTT